MRELNLTEIEAVSGGETVMEPIIVVGTRPGSRSVYAAEWEARGMTAQEYVFGSGDGGGLLQLAGLPIEGVYTDNSLGEDTSSDFYVDENGRVWDSKGSCIETTMNDLGAAQASAIIAGAAGGAAGVGGAGAGPGALAGTGVAMLMPFIMGTPASICE
jgi:hypothetical protein